MLVPAYAGNGLAKKTDSYDGYHPKFELHYNSDGTIKNVIQIKESRSYGLIGFIFAWFKRKPELTEATESFKCPKDDTACEQKLDKNRPQVNTHEPEQT